MPITADDWREMYAVFDPTVRVEYEDADLFVGRPGAVAASIADDLRLGLERAGKWVVCGAMGSGKSSELVQLARLLEGSHAVVGVDLPRSVARVDRLRPAEVLYLIGLAAIRASRDLWDHELPEATTAALHRAFMPLLGDNRVEINPREIVQGVSLLVAHAASAAIGGSGALVGAASGLARAAAGALPGHLQRTTPLGGATRAALDSDPELDQLRVAVDAVLDEVAKVRQPVVLVDGLDKIQTLTAIRDLFSDSRVLALPRAPVVYTGPITLMLATEWQATAGFFRRERLTNVVVHAPGPSGVEIDADKIADGRAAMRSVIERRLFRLGDRTIDDVFDAVALERIIDMSGGLLRDLIHLVNRAVRWCLRRQEARITAAIADEAIVEMRKEFEITLTTRRVEELVHVARCGEPSGNGEESADLLLRGYVLPYANGRVWFEPHPLLRGLRPGLQAGR